MNIKMTLLNYYRKQNGLLKSLFCIQIMSFILTIIIITIIIVNIHLQ